MAGVVVVVGRGAVLAVLEVLAVVLDPLEQAAATHTRPTSPRYPSAAIRVRACIMICAVSRLSTGRFETATKFMTVGTTPTVATCKNLVNAVLPKISKTPVTLIDIATRTPDTVLVRALRRDISDKFFMVSGCSKHVVSPVFADDIYANAKVMFARFKVYGIVI